MSGGSPVRRQTAMFVSTIVDIGGQTLGLASSV